ncbi:MAG: hypothetical protein D6743_19455 [Calditrichaeota bacterium]|nr:MAG: hypothetical protein D6743_19455 [Calditrichota bacterium]
MGMFVCAACFVSPLWSQLYAPPGGKVSFGVVSRNIWRGFDVLPDNEPALRGALHYVFGSTGFETLIVGQTAFSNRDEIKGRHRAKDIDEIDLTLKYFRSLSPSFGLTVGLNQYFFPRIDDFDNAYSPEGFVGLTLQNIPLFPTVTFFYDFNLGDDLYVRLSLEQFVPMGERLFLLKIAAGYNNGQYGVSSGISDIELNFSTDFNISVFTLTPSINWVVAPENSVNRNNEIWFGGILSKRLP